MFIYKIKLKIVQSREDDWLLWMTTEHLPKIIDTHYFLSCLFLKLLETPEISYSSYEIQCVSESHSQIVQYETTELRLMHELLKKFGKEIKDIQRGIYKIMPSI